MDSELEKKEKKNFKLFQKMSKEIHKDNQEKKWEKWKFEPEANFFMTTNKRVPHKKLIKA